MPYLQLDVNGHYAAANKKRLARKPSETYSGKRLRGVKPGKRLRGVKPGKTVFR
jgi:hypothetical protein